MSNDIVFTGRCDTYNLDRIKNIIHKGLDSIKFKISKSKILLKPNLLSSKTPEKAVTTHPEFIKAISELFIDCSCDVYIGDSPGYESIDKVLLHSGIMDVVKSHGLKVSKFNRRIKINYKGISPYRDFVFGDDPDSYDFIINIPKLKTHTMMGLTLGVKNTFGFIPAFDKAKWHLRAGRDRLLFASLLVDIHTIVNPSITILDGVFGMDGDGPSNGRVRNFGLVALSKSAFVLDYMVEKAIPIMNILPISELAFNHNIININNINIIYNDYEQKDLMMMFEGFQLPATIKTDWNLPNIIKRTLGCILIKKPRIIKTACKNCNICLSICPVDALIKSNMTPVFNYKKCIRCYCCQEMCPEGAISIS